VSRETAIEGEGRVIEVLPRSVFRVEMPNGHRVLAHLSRNMRVNLVRIDPGDTVRIEMSPFDLSEGCIVSKE
jgi:translation initiation factor IF-1